MGQRSFRQILLPFGAKLVRQGGFNAYLVNDRSGEHTKLTDEENHIDAKCDREDEYTRFHWQVQARVDFKQYLRDVRYKNGEHIFSPIVIIIHHISIDLVIKMCSKSSVRDYGINNAFVDINYLGYFAHHPMKTVNGGNHFT